jgi:hypothetical protein
MSPKTQAAIAGNGEAKRTLEHLGIDPQEAIKDVEGALAKCFRGINDAEREGD